MGIHIPNPIKIYHIIHVSKLPAILAENCLLSDSEVRKHTPVGETIGMKEIKQRRMDELRLTSHPDLFVGACVPFYFCPRSIMLYMFHMRNHPDIEYRGGQEPIIHLVADMRLAVEWAEQTGLRWAFTNSNAGSRYFNDYAKLSDLDKIDWNAIQARDWRNCKEEKQAEFLLEQRFPWELIESIGVFSLKWVDEVDSILSNSSKYHPTVKQKPDWYY